MSRAEGEEPRQLGFPEAIEAAARAAGGEWADRALAAIVKTAGSSARFTSDDVWAHFKEPSPSGDARALGGILRTAAKKGYIVRLPGEYRESTRASRHAGPVQVWESCIFVPR